MIKAPDTLVSAPSQKPNFEQGKISVVDLLLIVTQLGLLLFIIRQFQIESQAFLRFAGLAFSGFVIHALLPFRYRLGFFALLSMTSIVVVLGVTNAAWLLAIGCFAIGLIHLPISYRSRCVLILLCAFGLALLRMGWVSSPLPSAIWPILGSMLMFRIISYMYDLSHHTTSVSLPGTLSYFFMLPNVCFPLFPVVDYKTFRRNYFDTESREIYQIGLDWMSRGVIQLLLYRAVYYHFTLAVSEVTSSGKLSQFLLANFLLYLRVSGLFHLIVGILHLFGFNLPETHHRYLLSGSFTDFWRRINIYWKDFMLKVFYYPLYFKIKNWGGTQALVVSTLLVFIATWFLHAYQWFWLRGSFLISPQDVGFWAILAILVVVNSLSEAKHGRERTLRSRSRSWSNYLLHALRTVATFLAICALWSFWTCESLTSWASLWSAAQHTTAADVPWLAILFAVMTLIGVAATLELRRSGVRVKPVQTPLGRQTLMTLASLLIVASLGVSAVYTQLNVDSANFIHSLRSGRLSRLDTAKLERGYYEDLLAVDRLDGQLWEVYMNRPENWLDAHQGSGLDRYTGDFSYKKLASLYRSSTPYGILSTNRWGMRDQDYNKEPARDTYRVALLGASSVMGWGVADNETFESLLEEKLNAKRPGGRYRKYEILNFAIPGHKPLQQLPVLEEALTFKPKAVFYVATGRETSQAAFYLVEAIRNRRPIPYDYLRDLANKAEVSATVSESEGVKRLVPYRKEIISWFYQKFVSSCRERDALPVWIFLPMAGEGAWQEETEGFTKIARESGFVMIDLGDIYKNQDIHLLRLADWDEHPNVRGHEMIAARLYSELLVRDQALSLGLAP